MKRNRIYKTLSMLITLTIIGFACTEDMSDVRFDADLTTTQSMKVTASTAEVEGYIMAQNEAFSEVGVVYSFYEEPLLSEDEKVVYDGERNTAAFTVTLTGLDYAKKYYARAYGIYSGGEMYGPQVSFTTLPRVPMVTTVEVSDITGNSAKTGGSVTDDGRDKVTERGLVFGVSELPVVGENDVIVAEEAGLGEFVTELKELLGNTTYYVRAYAVNGGGVGYGSVFEFKTKIDLPVATTDSVNTVTKVSAMLYGNAPYDGGDAITAKGFVWGLTENPTIDNEVVDMMAEEAEFSYELTGLDLNTTYYIRAFATNSIGTNYGEQIAFKTLADITKLFVVGDYNGWTNNANAEFITSTATSEGMAEGYIYLTTGGIKFIQDPPSWDDASTFGDNKSGGLTNGGENIEVAEDGYYRLRANLADMTYSLVKLDWGVIGDATPGGWDGETGLTYDSEVKILKGAFTFNAGEFKFRANGNWDYNYGSNEADGHLQEGGENIPLPVAGEYAITLDLSVPNEYIYSANRWGMIGGATPGGWDADSFMAWDAVNKVFTVTLDLTVDNFKFRANGEWAVDLGGDMSDLTQGGADIAVSTAGNYTITLDPWSGVGTLTKN